MTIHLNHQNAGNVILQTDADGNLQINPDNTNGIGSVISSGVLYEHAHTISSAYSISSGNNAMSAGPITVATGGSVTVPTGSAWTVV